ncbi:carboxypeptidase M32 [Paenibacillus sp. CMAA1364]
MEEQVKIKLTQFHELVRKIRGYYEAVALLHWDLRTGAPRKGAEARSETIGMLDTEMFKLQISEDMADYLAYFTQEHVMEQLDEVDRKIILECQKEYELNKLIPTDKFQEYSALTAHAQTLWEEAKDKSDFAGFEPYLSKIVEMKKEFIQYWGVKGTRYDTLIDMYEPDMTVEKLDRIFTQLRTRLVPLVEAILSSPVQPEKKFLQQKFSKEQQEKFGLFILQEMGYDFEAGRQDESVHPFATSLNIGDVRITTNYVEEDVTNALFSSLHEGGHALYEQNVDVKFAGTPLAEGTSMGIHESQSRLWENMIGRSYGFWERYYKDLQQYFDPQLTDVVLEDFYRAINRVENSLIRIDADELTYNLHIIIRYEIEKMLFNEELSVKDLPDVWNAKYKEYLGIEPPNDGAGVLQDVHWSGGDFGYFASYSLGNMYAAQFLNTMRKELPHYDQWIAEGNLLPIKEWLTTKIYQYGKSLTPSEIIMQVTGEELNPNYLADYLEEKYKEIYQI